ncbi:MAG: glycosyltransferase family 2 protein, partial [Thermodesulfobacteriota bacterium]
PTYKRKQSVLRILHALVSQTFPSNEFEVIVSIDGSTDGTKEAVDNFKADFNLRSCWEPNTGRASACNIGIIDAQGELLIILDDDMEPSPQLLEAHYTAHQGHTKLGVIGAAPMTVAENAPLFINYIRDKFNSHIKKISQPCFNLKVWDFYSGNFSIKKQLMLEIGMFDESFKVYGHEDVELANRLIKAGVKIIFSPDALCLQHYEDNLANLAHKTINSGKTAVQLVNSQPDTFGELQLVDYNLTGWRWRTLRLILIRASIILPFITDIVVFIINRFEKSNPKIYRKLYHLATNYFFWLGVWTALRHDTNKQLLYKIKSYKKPT